MGKYTDIIDIVAPASAAAGSKVDVTVKVKNIDTVYDHLVACVAEYDSTRFIDLAVIIKSLQTHSFTGSFTMPNKSAIIYAYSYYPVGAEWIFDDSAQKSVSLAIVYQGTISKKELEYNESRATIPASNIPQNKRGLVHIWGRNDMTTSQRMGIWWQIKDPDGVVRETYSKWETFWTGAGSAQEFIGGRFDLNRVGTYKIDVSLYMNPSDPQIVDSYSGTLCTVQAVVPSPEFSGFAISDYSKR